MIEMSEVKITKCDICGEERRSDSEIKYHWSDTIDDVLLTFEGHAGIQTIPFEGVMCTGCAKGLSKYIFDEIDRRRKLCKENNNATS